MFRRLLLTICLAVSSLSAWSYHVPHVDFDSMIGGHRTSGGGTLFFPFGQLGPNLFFTQGTVGRFKANWVGDVGLGYRVQTAPNFGWGINGFFDYAYSEISALNWFGGGGGLELFGSFWEARLNGYSTTQGLRLHKRQRVTSSSQAVINNRPVVIGQLKTTSLFEVGRWGLDGEVGGGFCLGPGSLWGYVGYFRFVGNGVAIIQGPRARAEYKLPLQMAWGMPELWVGVEYRRDDVHRSQTSATIHVQIPLFPQQWRRRCPNLSTFKRMGDSVRRQNGPLIDQLRRVQIVDTVTGLWFIRQGAMGIGTQLDPTSLANANANSLPGDFIFALGPQNIDINAELGTAYTLMARQTLVSFGNATSVTLDISGVPFVVNDITGSGRGPLAQTVAGNPAIVVQSDNVVRGIGVIGGNRGITGNAQNNATVTDVRLTEEAAIIFADSPIRFTNMTGVVTINQNSITMMTPGGAAINLGNAAGQTAAYLVVNNTLTSTGANPTEGIATRIDGAATVGLGVGANTITGFQNGGIFVNQTGVGGRSTIVIEQNTTTNTGAITAGIGLNTDGSASNSEMTFRVTGNTINTAPGGGVRLAFASLGAAPVTINGAVNGMNGINTAGPPGVGALVDIGFAGATDVATLQIDDTRFNAVTGISVASIMRTAGTLNLTLTNSADTNAVGPSTVVYDSNMNGTGTFCLTMTGNNTTRAKAVPPATRNIQLVQTAGTFNVTDLAAVTANNNGLTTNVQGTVTSVTTPCPLPKVPG